MIVGSSEKCRAQYVWYSRRSNFLLTHLDGAGYGLDELSENDVPSRATEDPEDPMLPAEIPMSNGPLGQPEMQLSHLSGEKTDTSRPPLCRSNTQITRDAVFGEADEELSDIEDDVPHKPPSIKGGPRAKVKHMPPPNTTIVTPPVLKGRIMDSDDEVDTPHTLQNSRKKGPPKKKVVAVSETEDDEFEVPKQTAPIVRKGNFSSPSGKTRASALADRLEAAAAAATKKSLPPVDSLVVAISVQSQSAGLAARGEESAALALEVSDKRSAHRFSRRSSLAEVGFPTSDNSDLPPNSKMAQPTQETRPADPLGHSAAHSAFENVHSGFYDTYKVSQAAVGEHPVAIHPASVGLHLVLLWLLSLGVWNPIDMA